MARKQSTNDRAAAEPSERAAMGDRGRDGEGRKPEAMSAAGAVAARGASASTLRQPARGAERGSERGAAAGRATAEVGRGGATMLAPDSAIAPAEEVGAGTWVANQRITGLWGSAQSGETWVYVAGAWRKLSTHSPSAALALTTIAAHARQTNCRVDYREQADGTISELYVWQ